MSKHGSIAGGKLAPSHTTTIPMAAKVVDTLKAIPEITKISLGIINPGVSPARHGSRVRILDIQGGILLKIRGSTSVQEIRLYGSNLRETKVIVARALRDAQIAICFR